MEIALRVGECCLSCHLMRFKAEKEALKWLSKTGIAALALQRQLGVCYNSIKHKLMQVMKERDDSKDGRALWVIRMIYAFKIICLDQVKKHTILYKNRII